MYMYLIAEIHTHDQDVPFVPDGYDLKKAAT